MKRFLTVHFFFFFVLFALNASDSKSLFQVHPGEELEYLLRWGPFKVGRGYLKVEPDTVVDGVKCHHLHLSVRTNDFADALYKVRSDFHSYVSVENPRVIRYEVSQHEGKTHKDATIVFDWNQLLVTFHREGRDPRDPVPISDNTWDPLSVVYYFRNLLDENVPNFTLPATDGKKHLKIEIENRGIKNKEIGERKVSAFHVVPDTKEMSGVFKKSKKSKINMWYSNDQSRVPILIRSKVIVGSFYAELVDISTVNEG